MAATTLTHARHSAGSSSLSFIEQLREAVHFAGSASAGLFGHLDEAVHAAREAHARRRAVRELRSLNDRMLKDIGFDRSEIESIARGMDPTRLHR